MTKKKEKKLVFDTLFESCVCFAVCIANNSFINREVAAFSKDYFVIINKCDARRVKELTFYPTEGYKQVCERNLSADEIEVFKMNKDKFVNVRRNEYGRVYELKEQSFKAAYDRISQQLRRKVIIEHKMSNQVCEKGYRNNPLTTEQQANNRIKSKTRAWVEHVFGFMEQSMRGLYIWSVGLPKATSILGLINLTYNIFRYEQLSRRTA